MSCSYLNAEENNPCTDTTYRLSTDVSWTFAADAHRDAASYSKTILKPKVLSSGTYK